ncbi:hypothetical protein KQX54_013086 [Cotesia glomerata]|uniref:Uncharacterized protein n=1 Tax=Cotesia glomerata TaxID=32391 RepID=A0AAV7HWZ1_COTGL|nr:hypothetical protein KQX54_013086 [Cotesia glomerata]
MENNEKQLSTEPTIPIDLSRASETIEQHHDPSSMQRGDAYHGNQNHPVFPNSPQIHHVPYHQINQQPQHLYPHQNQVMFVPQTYYTYPSPSLNHHSIPSYNFTPNPGVQYMPNQFGGSVGISAHPYQHPVMPPSFHNDQLSGKSDCVPVTSKGPTNCELLTSSDYNPLTSGDNLSTLNKNNSKPRSAMTNNTRTSQVTESFPKKEVGKPNLNESELLKICKQKSAVDKASTGTYRRRNFNCRNNCVACQDYCQRDCVRCRFIENLDKLL